MRTSSLKREPPTVVDRPLVGVAFNLTALSVFVVQDVIMKLLSDRYPVWQFGVLRSVVAVSAIAMVLVLSGHIHAFRPRRVGLIVVRGLLTFCGYTCYYLAIAAMPLADAVSIMFSAPLIVTALSVPLLGERVGPRRWSAVIVGFIGVLLMVRPGFQTVQPATFLAVAGAVTYAFGVIITRRIGAVNSGATLAMYQLLVFGLASGAGSVILLLLGPQAAVDPSYAFLTLPWVVPSWFHLGLMVLTGLVSAVGHYCLAQAYRLAPPSLVGVFEYTYFVWVVIVGYVIWGDVPSTTTLVGVAIVIGSGVYVLRREATLLAFSARPR